MKDKKTAKNERAKYYEKIKAMIKESYEELKELGYSKEMAMLLAKIDNGSELDDGLLGKAYEMAITLYITKRPRYLVKAQGKSDIYATIAIVAQKRIRAHFEIKTACGKLDEMVGKYIIYCPYVDLTQEPQNIGYVMPMTDFWQMTENYNGRGKFLRIDKDGHTHIQSFYVSEEVRPGSSKPIAKYLINTLKKYPTVAEFFMK